MEAGQPAYRGRQLFEALYRQRVEAVDQITTLPSSFRSELTKNYAAGLPQTQKKFVSLDGTVRYLIGFADGQSVETVWMPEGDNGEQGDGSEAGEEDWMAHVGCPTLVAPRACTERRRRDRVGCNAPLFACPARQAVP